jgi:hypothetical protein
VSQPKEARRTPRAVLGIEESAYNKIRNAEIAYQLLNEEFHRWVIDVYPRKIHTGLGDRQSDVYEESIRQNVPRPLRKNQNSQF